MSIIQKPTLSPTLTPVPLMLDLPVGPTPLCQIYPIAKLQHSVGIIFTDYAPRPIQSIGYNVCVSICLRKGEQSLSFQALMVAASKCLKDC